MTASASSARRAKARSAYGSSRRSHEALAGWPRSTATTARGSSFASFFEYTTTQVGTASGLRFSADKLARKVGSILDVLVDAVEIDGEVHLRGAGGLQPGDIVAAKIEDTDEHDLYGVPA
jgi:hypothetical protein